MKIKEVIERLQEMYKYVPEAVVQAYDPEMEDYFPITGYVYGHDQDGNQEVKIYTDEDGRDPKDALAEIKMILKETKERSTNTEKMIKEILEIIEEVEF